MLLAALTRFEVSASVLALASDAVFAHFMRWSMRPSMTPGHRNSSARISNAQIF
jgi:hypothetical protein